MTPTSAGPPAWCTPEHLRERQDDARERLGELTQRLEAATGGGAQGGAQKDDRRTQRLVAAAKEALPHLADAAAAMQAASTALARDRANEAAAREDEAIESLATAAERFSGVRELIELAFAEQSTIALLLDPTATAEAMEAASRPPLDAPERARLVGAGVTRNQERLERLAGLFEEEVAALGEAKAPDPKAPSAPDERDRYREAEKERRAAADATGRLALSLKLKDAEEPLLPIAREARDHIEAMRRLFFTIVEHLEELARRQAETRDATATAAGESEAAKRKEAAAPPRTQEERHAATAKAIARALGDEAKQATATADVGAKLAQAADEVGEAARGMDSATNELALAAPDLEAALGHEKDALERLAAAIALLKPPDRGGGSQDQAQPKPSESSVSRDQAQRRLEGVREREADRLRGDRKRREATAPEPVEKDW
jgi:hypothetical protein